MMNDAARRDREAAGALGLPPRDIFPPEMPRYPNVWFFVPTTLALRGEYPYALRLLDRLLDERLELRDSFYDDVRNPGLRRLIGDPGEGSDYQARIGPLAAWPGGVAGAPAHAHQLHARFYVSPLVREGLTKVSLSLAGSTRECFRIPASVHFEVATEEPSHPYVDACPVCGLTGEYALAIDPRSQDYCLKVHDPLGVELLVHGTIRGTVAAWPDGRAAACLSRRSSGPDIAFDEHAPGPYGCARLARVLVGAGEHPR
jgi:hypothetical protein